MKNKINVYLVAILFCLVISNYLSPAISQAASAEIKISSDVQSVTVGENIFVYITIKSDNLFGDFEANLTYDDEILEYQNGPSVITGSSGFLKISDRGISEATQSRKYTLKFEATKVGVCDISFVGRAMVYDYESGIEMSISSNVYSVDVKPKKTASDNAKLKSLKISPAELKPAFNVNTKEYSASVGNEVEKLVVNAIPEDVKASVTVSGNNLLQEGENKIIVTVLAESGSVIEYNINVFREISSEDSEDKPNETDTSITPSTDFGIFEVIRENGNIYAVYQGKYQLIEPDNQVTIPTGYIKTDAILSDIKITAYALKNDMENDFILIYARNELGEEGFYRYDRNEKTLQRYVPDAVIDNEKVNNNSDEIIPQKDYKANLNKAATVIALLSGACVILITIIISMLLKRKRKK